MSERGRDVLRCNESKPMVLTLVRDGTGWQPCQSPAASAGDELLSVHLICKGDDSSDLQVCYEIMSADPQCIYTLMSPEAKVPENVLLLLSQRMWR